MLIHLAALLPLSVIKLYACVYVLETILGRTVILVGLESTLERLLTAVHHIVAYLTFLKVLFARDTGLVPWTLIHAAAQRAQYL